MRSLHQIIVDGIVKDYLDQQRAAFEVMIDRLPECYRHMFATVLKEHTEEIITRLNSEEYLHRQEMAHENDRQRCQNRVDNFSCYLQGLFLALVVIFILYILLRLADGSYSDYRDANNP
jgi:hypothetical protein